MVLVGVECAQGFWIGGRGAIREGERLCDGGSVVRGDGAVYVCVFGEWER